MRLIFASVVRGIISQRLVKRADGHGMVPAVEVLLSTALTRECIAIKERTHELQDAIARGQATYGMQTFDQSLMALFRQGLITYEEAIAQATNPDDFALKVRGIDSTSDGRWETFDKADQPAEKSQAARCKIDRFCAHPRPAPSAEAPRRARPSVHAAAVAMLACAARSRRGGDTSHAPRLHPLDRRRNPSPPPRSPIYR
jgi:twitching motility protein PilT